MSTDGNHDENELEIGHFVTLVKLFLLCAAILSVGGAVPAMILHNRRLGAGASLVAVYGLFVYLNGRWGSRSESVIAAATSVSYGFLVLIVALSFLTPYTYPSLTVAAVIAVAFGLPYVQGARLKRLLGASLVSIVIIQINGYRSPGPEFIGLPQWVIWTTDRTATALACCLLYALIWVFSNRFNETLRQEKATHALVRQAETRSSFLAQASALLAESLDYQETLARVGRLAVPAIADWTTVTIIEDDGTWRRLVALHKDVDKAPLMERYRTQRPPDEQLRARYTALFERHEPLLEPHVSNALLARIAQTPERLEMLQELGVGSAMLIPMLVRGRLLGVMAFLRTSDARPYTKADLELARELVARAAFAIDNAHLYQAEQRAKLDAEAAVGVRDSFLSIAGHELKSPLSALELQIELLKRMVQRELEGAVSEQLYTRLSRAGASASRLERLVGELLDVSRITTGHLTLEPEGADLTEVVREVAGDLAETARRAGCEIRVEADGPMCGVWDRMRVIQVTTNLLENAIKYGRGHPIDVRLDTDHESAKMTVTDQGIGISEADQARIFHRFERAVSEKQYSGLGLGLWIARQIVEASGGTIAVRSTLGGGASFIVQLPLSPGPESHAAIH